MSISENWSQVRTRVAAAAAAAGRPVDSVRIVAVSKTFPASSAQAAYDAGARVLGENRVQEALPKIEALPGDAEWHLIGHLQTNKARLAIGRFSLIHSVDSVRLANELQRQAERQELVQPILLQVDVAGEDTKSGFAPAELTAAARDIARLERLHLEGLMTIGPPVDDPEDARWVFRRLRELRDGLRQDLPDAAWLELSMGMTHDFEAAIQEGATLVRVGRAIFGERTAGAGAAPPLAAHR
ncbi:MAG TPA: YggS family pyridoxal phosphate-dependent enzyme [Chloroflexota bacterium]|nr:YggS family pyridoxal phosphate-dependent enzyme [Chloroflexota bacterium]